MTNPPLPTHRNPQREPLASGVPPARYKLLSPASLPITRAPIAVTTQQSPTALLESPVLLTQVKAESSPTTGTFFMPISPRSNPSSFAESPRATRSLVETSILKCSNRSCIGSSKRDGASVSLNPEEQQQLKQSKRQENPSPHDLTLSISPSSSMPEMQLQSESRKSKEVAAMESSSDDGYSWRKYGEKPVNGNELHRSYYECMHPTCQVKKQLECSNNGRITDVIYKGSHDHAKPQLGYNPSEAKKILSFREEERTKSQANKDDPEVMAAASNLNGQNDERRREDSGAIDDPPAAKAVREPRVVVQTLSEIDVLDDGYRWRKYGQKVVKGNPNPRSYYKCTNVGCGVRKHVERASHDPKAVITTYEGKHNHDVPTQRNANNDASPLMATSNGNDQLGQVAGFLGALPLQYHHQPGGGEIVSLDLEVGLSPRFNGRDSGSMLHPPPRTQITNFSIHMGGSNHNIPVLRATTVNPAAFCEGSYVPREARGENLAFNAVPANHSCNSYEERFGRLLAGP